jgi:hypothetical protein
LKIKNFKGINCAMHLWILPDLSFYEKILLLGTIFYLVTCNSLLNLCSLFRVAMTTLYSTVHKPFFNIIIMSGCRVIRLSLSFHSTHVDPLGMNIRLEAESSGEFRHGWTFTPTVRVYSISNLWFCWPFRLYKLFIIHRSYFLSKLAYLKTNLR